MQLTPRAKQSLEHARELARDLGHTLVGSQHIVFGLFQLGSGVHCHVLRSLGFTSDSLRVAITAEAPLGSISHIDPTLDISATGVLERADSEATAMGHTYIGTEHILLALLAEEHGGAVHLFASRGVDLSSTRQILLQEMQQSIQ